jgi:SAM-dependent methyltransferase
VPDITAAHIAAWSDPAQPSALAKDDAIRAMHALGPRVRFLKTLPFAARMLDAGAGDGGTMVLRDWPEPARPDVAMYAWAGISGAGFDRYAGAEVGFWPQDPPRFGGMMFDAIFCANFIEHIDDPVHFVAWICEKLTPGGRIFLEWPRPESVGLPTTAELAAHGVNVATGAYHDDATHRGAVPPAMDDIKGALQNAGLRIMETGISRFPFIDQQVAIHARRDNDFVAMTLAYWSYSGWLQFLMAEKA